MGIEDNSFIKRDFSSLILLLRLRGEEPLLISEVIARITGNNGEERASYVEFLERISKDSLSLWGNVFKKQTLKVSKIPMQKENSEGTYHTLISRLEERWRAVDQENETIARELEKLAQQMKVPDLDLTAQESVEVLNPETEFCPDSMTQAGHGKGSRDKHNRTQIPAVHEFAFDIVGGEEGCGFATRGPVVIPPLSENNMEREQEEVYTTGAQRMKMEPEGPECGNAESNDPETEGSVSSVNSEGVEERSSKEIPPLIPEVNEAEVLRKMLIQRRNKLDDSNSKPLQFKNLVPVVSVDTSNTEKKRKRPTEIENLKKTREEDTSERPLYSSEPLPDRVQCTDKFSQQNNFQNVSGKGKKYIDSNTYDYRTIQKKNSGFDKPKTAGELEDGEIQDEQFPKNAYPQFHKPLEKKTFYQNNLRHTNVMENDYNPRALYGRPQITKPPAPFNKTREFNYKNMSMNQEMRAPNNNFAPKIMSQAPKNFNYNWNAPPYRQNLRDRTYNKEPAQENGSDVALKAYFLSMLSKSQKQQSANNYPETNSWQRNWNHYKKPYQSNDQTYHQGQFEMRPPQMSNFHQSHNVQGHNAVKQFSFPQGGSMSLEDYQQMGEHPNFFHREC